MLERLHEAGGVLAVVKPAGLPTQAPPGIESAESIVRRALFGEVAAAADADAGPRRRPRHPGGFLGIPHRLDRPVSGVLLVATTPRAARQLSRQFERRQVGKSYVALVAAAASLPAPGTVVTWQDRLRKLPDEPRAEIAATDAADAREAITRVRLLGPVGPLAALELVPFTGRMHQLRVQAAARGLPVAGDALYGGPPWGCAAGGDPPAADPRDRPIALHAWRIEFVDPQSGAPVSVTCPPPAGWPAELAALLGA